MFLLKHVEIQICIVIMCSIVLHQHKSQIIFPGGEMLIILKREKTTLFYILVECWYYHPNIVFFLLKNYSKAKNKNKQTKPRKSWKMQSSIQNKFSGMRRGKFKGSFSPLRYNNDVQLFHYHLVCEYCIGFLLTFNISCMKKICGRRIRVKIF